ncbi:MAG: Unknown protein [uncultured Sulfurovum sp.]|uniref:Uncharacterized protein n=1 Tax=uncultured Sulfurovum sp. TaxID=269237 RepID=A0A6S6TZH7_9BACT|nr:MAG: Unknown protein [uncultured Sulfurovum sp.]
MIRLWILSIGFMVSLQAQELFIVTDKGFQEGNITIQEVKEIFLGKKRFINGKKILVMNYEFNHSVRRCFEKTVLKKSVRSIERYWQKAYYKGLRPPKIVKSEEMLFSYMQEVQPSIGYIEKTDNLAAYLKVLFTIECKL